MPTPRTGPVSVPVRTERVVSPVGTPGRVERVGPVRVGRGVVAPSVAPPATGVGRAVPHRAGDHARVVPRVPRVPIGVPAGIRRRVSAGAVPTVVVRIDPVRRRIMARPAEAERGPDEDRAGSVVGGVEAEAYAVEHRTDADGEGDVALRRCRSRGQGRSGDQDQGPTSCGSHGVLQMAVPDTIYCNPRARSAVPFKYLQWRHLWTSSAVGGPQCVRRRGHPG